MESSGSSSITFSYVFHTTCFVRIDSPIENTSLGPTGIFIKVLSYRSKYLRGLKYSPEFSKRHNVPFKDLRGV